MKDQSVKKKGTLARLYAYAKPYWARLVFILILIAISALATSYQPRILQQVIDQDVRPGAGGAESAARAQDAFRWAMIYLAMIIIAFVTSYSQVYLLKKTGTRIVYDMRQELYNHVLSLPMSFFDKHPMGSLVTRVTNDTEAVSEMFTTVLVDIFSNLFTLITIIVMLFRMNAALAKQAVMVLPLIAVLTIIFRKFIRKVYDKERALLSKINSKLSENITGMKVIKTFYQEEAIYQDFNQTNEEYRDTGIKEVKYFSIFRPCIEALRALTLALLLWKGGLANIEGAVTFGVIYAFTDYIERFFAPILNMAEVFNIIQSAMTSARRIFKLMDEEEEANPGTRQIGPEGLQGEIEFRHVWFRYDEGEAVEDLDQAAKGELLGQETKESVWPWRKKDQAPAAQAMAGKASAESGQLTQPEPGHDPAASEEENWILKDVSFHIKPGQFVAFVGATGSGKTTIMSLISRFYCHQKGEILIDGHPIEEYDIRSLRRNIGVVQQDVFLFTGNIIDNLRLGRDWVSRQDAIEASQMVKASSFIDQLPKRYDDQVTERGSTFSAGQRQLLSFARTIAGHPAILILDEATSNIDTETEALIQEAINQMAQNRTMLAVAHRISTVADADWIIVMKDGEIAEAGDKDSLIAKEGIFHSLYELQYQH